MVDFLLDLRLATINPDTDPLEQLLEQESTHAGTRPREAGPAPPPHPRSIVCGPMAGTAPSLLLAPAFRGACMRTQFPSAIAAGMVPLLPRSPAWRDGRCCATMPRPRPRRGPPAPTTTQTTTTAPVPVGRDHGQSGRSPRSRASYQDAVETSAPVTKLTDKTEYNLSAPTSSPTRALNAPCWLNVLLPIRPNGASGWI